MIFAAAPLGAAIVATLAAAAVAFGGWQKIQNSKLETTIAEQAAAVQIATSQQAAAEAGRAACEAALSTAQQNADTLIAAAHRNAVNARERAADAQAAAAAVAAASDDHAADAPATEIRIRKIYERLTVRVTTAPPPDDECARTADILNSVLQ